MTPGEAEHAISDVGHADEALREAALLLDAGSTAGAASRLYYAVFHAARAALTVKGASSRTHVGQITLFESTFGAAPILGKLLQLRIAADYGRVRFETPLEDLRVTSQIWESLAGAIRFEADSQAFSCHRAARSFQEACLAPDRHHLPIDHPPIGRRSQGAYPLGELLCVGDDPHQPGLLVARRMGPPQSSGGQARAPARQRARAGTSCGDLSTCSTITSCSQPSPKS